MAASSTPGEGLLPYEGAAVDVSQGIPEVNWALIHEARRFGVGFVATGTTVYFGGIESAELRRQATVEIYPSHDAGTENHPTLDM